MVYVYNEEEGSIVSSSVPPPDLFLNVPQGGLWWGKVSGVVGCAGRRGANDQAHPVVELR